ncbi:MAG: prohibitin family protein [Armatimonadetes bacterium]|nr:prohibitin family protein [Armatimonadota bacterium]
MFFSVILVVLGLVVFSTAKAAQQGAVGMRITGLVLLVLGVLSMFKSSVVVVPAGNVGVVAMFGSVNPKPLSPGLHVINPVANVEMYEIRTQEYTMSATQGEGQQKGDDAIRTLSRDGLPMPIDVTITYRPNPASVPWLYQNFGTEQEVISKIVRPSARAAVRDAMANFSAQEAYASRRAEVPAKIQEELETLIETTIKKSEAPQVSPIIVQQVLLRNIELPDKLKASIEAKLTAEQEALRMEFVLQKEKQEAERKRIEAKGISDFQNIVSAGLNDKLLQWKGIEATQVLAESNNAKVVIIGSGKGGLPVILNTDGSVSSAAK